MRLEKTRVQNKGQREGFFIDIDADEHRTCNDDRHCLRKGEAQYIVNVLCNIFIRYPSWDKSGYLIRLRGNRNILVCLSTTLQALKDFDEMNRNEYFGAYRKI